MSQDPNAFEEEMHADDDLHCERCGRKIRYCHGDTDLCDQCRKSDAFDQPWDQEPEDEI